MELERGVDTWVWRVSALLTAYFAVIVVRSDPGAPLVLAGGALMALACGAMLLPRTASRAVLLLLGALAAVLAHGVAAPTLAAQPRPGFLVLVTVLVALGASRAPMWSRRLQAAVAVAAYAVLAGGSAGLVAGELVSALAAAVGSAVTTTAMRRGAVRSDRARAEREAVLASRVRQQAAEAAQAQTRRLLHDEMIASLAVLRLDPGLAVVAARGARQRLDDFERTPEVRDGPAPLVLPLRHLELEIDDRRSETDPRVPDEVWNAACAAAREALRNVARHSGVDRARVVVTGAPGGGLVMTVQDDGRGFDPATVRGFGLTASVRERMWEVGGHATVVSRPGAGTVVRLAWTPAAHRQEAGATARWRGLRDAIGDLRGLVRAFALLQLLSGAALMVALPGPRPVASLLLGALVVAGTLLLLRQAPLRPLTRTEVAAATLLPPVALAAGLWLAGPGALRGFESWIVALAEVPAIVLALVAARPAAYAAMGLASGTVLVAAVVDPTLSPGEVLGPIVQPTMYGVLFSMIGFALLRLGARAREAQDESLRLLFGSAGATARRRALRTRLRGLDLRVRDLLDAVVAGADPTSPRLAAETDLLVQALRDELAAPAALDDDARAVVERVRRAGGSVRLRPGLGDAHRARLTAALRAAVTDTDTPVSVVVAPREPDDVRVTVRPRQT